MFQVSISGKDDMAKKCHLKGSYRLYVEADSLCLCESKRNVVVCEWLYTSIRGYTKTDTLFVFECGRSFAMGEGVFRLKTKEGGKIFDAVHQKIQMMKGADSYTD